MMIQNNYKQEFQQDYEYIFNNLVEIRKQYNSELRKLNRREYRFNMSLTKEKNKFKTWVSFLPEKTLFLYKIKYKQISRNILKIKYNKKTFKINLDTINLLCEMI